MGGGNPGDDTANILQFLARYDSPAPFCLIASLVNPHDIFVYPNARLFGISGYDPSAFSDLPIELPPTYDENLSTKPMVQASFVDALNSVWPFASETPAVWYTRLYAYMTALADNQLSRILDLLDAKGLTEDTLIVRVADHGEMGLSHGGMRQKDYSAYEETIHIPMIFSNPRLFPRPLETDCLAGLIDVLPTLLTVAGLEKERDNGTFRVATSLRSSAILAYPFRSGFCLLMTTSSSIPKARRIFVASAKINGNSRFTSIPNGTYPTEYEMYDLVNDPRNWSI